MPARCAQMYYVCPLCTHALCLHLVHICIMRALGAPMYYACILCTYELCMHVCAHMDYIVHAALRIRLVCMHLVYSCIMHSSCAHTFVGFACILLSRMHLVHMCIMHAPCAYIHHA